MSTLREQILDIVAEVTERPEARTAGDDVDLATGLGLNSLHALEVVMQIEDRFGLSVPETEIYRIRTVGDLIALAERAAAAAPGKG